MTEIICEDEGTHHSNIRPEDIDAKKHLFNAFDNTETEISAGWIVRFLQKQGRGWVSFSLDEIENFYSEKHKDGFTFNRLINPEMVPPSLARAFAGHCDQRIPVGGGWIVKQGDRYYVTRDFIARCYKSSPTQVTV